MAISEKTILDPGQSKPGVPLKRATIFTIMGLLVGALIAAAMWQAADDGRQPGAQTAIVKSEGDIKPVATAVLDEEKKAAMDRAARPLTTKPSEPAPVAGGRGDSAVPRPASAAGRAVVPPDGVARADSSAALYANGVRRGRVAAGGGDDADVQVDAAARISKSLILDEAPSVIEQVVGTSRERAAVAKSLLLDPPVQSNASPSAAVDVQLDAIKAQVAAQTQPRLANWLRDYAADVAKDSGVVSMQPVVGGFVLRKGKVIPAVIVRKLNSDLPGRITALVRENVYDARGNLLIPYGSELVGNYDAQIKIGQERVLFAFSDLYLPNGGRFKLPAATGSDMEGSAGAAGDVNNHFFKIFGTSLLLAVLADGTTQPSNVTSYGGSGPVTAAGQVLSDTSRTILQRNQSIQPTITLEQGTRINVEVVADMVFPAPYSPSKRVMQ